LWDKNHLILEDVTTEGAVPMGSLTTESAYTRLVACLAFSETEDEALGRMEQFETG
jgi:hypothetical protein